MDADTKRKVKKRSREGKTKSHTSGVDKKRRKKEVKPKIKLSNYEKAVRKFNLNQQLGAQSKIENRRITKGPLKIKPAPDGMFLKARRSMFVRKKLLNDANEARKNEDINKIIDIGEEMHGKDRHLGKKSEEKDLFGSLNFPEICNKDGELRETDTGSEIPCCRKHGERSRRTTKRKVSLRGGTEPRSASSSFDIHDLSRKPANSERGLYDELMKTGSSSLTFPSTSSRDSKPRESEGDKLKIGREDFEEFAMKFKSALASDECPKLRVPGIADTVLRSLKTLYRRRREIYGDGKMREGAHHVQEDEVKSKKTNDPVLTWFFDAASRNKSEDSPRISASTDAWNAKSDSNICTFPFAGETSDEMGGSGGFSDFPRPIDLFPDGEEESLLQNAFPHSTLFERNLF